MKRCPQCAEQVKGAAKVCRFCGYQFSEQELRATERASLAVVIAVVVGCVGLIFAINDSGSRSPADKKPTFDRLMAEADARLRIEELVKARLRDPESAQFTHLSGGCGYVNSKNGFGGMSGKKKFIAGANDKVVFRSDGKETAFDTVWRLHCLPLSKGPG